MATAMKSTPHKDLSDPKELKAALMGAKLALLANRARTEQAKQLVDHVVAQVARGDGSERRRGLYGRTKQQIHRGVEGFLGDLLRAAGHEKAKGFVYRAMKAKGFTGEEVGYRAFVQVVDRLKELGLIDHYRGFPHRDAPFGGPKVVLLAKAARFIATPQLLKLADGFGVSVSNAKEHFTPELPRYPLQLRTSSSRNEYGQKVRGRRMRFDPTPKTNALEKEVQELNEFFEGFDLRGGTHRGFTRIFSEGDADDFNWNKGGRLYSQGDDNYQLEKEEVRLGMTIDGEPVCEIDIRASFLTIYLARFNQSLDWVRDPDPYDLRIPRGVAKDWFVATFGSKKHLEWWPKGIVDDYKKKTGHKLGKDYPIKVVRQKALQKFPQLKNWGEGKGSWSELMYLESAAIVSTMLRLKREHGIPSLSVHDSLIVPLSKREVAEKVLLETYLKVTRAKPMLINSPSP